MAMMASSSAYAVEKGSFDVFYGPTDVEITVPGLGSDSDDGDGAGAKFLAPIGEGKNFYFLGEFQETSLSNDVDLSQFRLGAGYQYGFGPFSVGGNAEYASISIDGTDVDGYGIHARFAYAPIENLSLFAQGGMLMLESDGVDVDGPEFTVGASYDFSKYVGAFIDYRITSLEDDDDVEYDIDGFRVGVRLIVGGK